MNIFLRLQYLAASSLYDLSNFLLETLQKLLFGRNQCKDPKTILIFSGGGGYLGDTLCAVPAYKAIQKQYPAARRILMMYGRKFPSSKEIFEAVIPFDEYLLFEESIGQKFAYYYSLMKKIRGLKVDLLFYLPGPNFSLFRIMRDMAFFKAAKCKNACGFHLSIHNFFKEAQRAYRQFDPEPVRLMKLLQNAGIQEGIHWDIPQISFPLQEKNSHPTVAVHPSARIPVKKWPIERFSTVCRYLQEHYKATIVIIGGKDASEETKTLIQSLSKPIIDLTGKTTYLEAAEILRQCDFLLTNDTGPLHLAEAVGTPIIGIYSARNFPNVWYPVGDNHIIIRKEVDCQICYLEECPIMICIKRISTEEVIDACKRMLEKKGFTPTVPSSQPTV